jgi:hypothetical protein
VSVHTRKLWSHSGDAWCHCYHRRRLIQIPKVIPSGMVVWKTNRRPHIFTVKARSRDGLESFQVGGKHDSEIGTYGFRLQYGKWRLIRIERARDVHENPAECSPDRITEVIGRFHIHRYREGLHDRCAQPMPELEFTNVIAALEHFFDLCNIEPVAILYDPPLFYF